MEYHGPDNHGPDNLSPSDLAAFDQATATVMHLAELAHGQIAHGEDNAAEAVEIIHSLDAQGMVDVIIVQTQVIARLTPATCEAEQ